MGLPALATPAAAEAVFVLDLDGLFRKLPAAARASLTWTRPVIESGLRRLRTEPLSEALLDEVAADLVDPMRAVSRVVGELVFANRDVFRTSLMDDLRREEDRLRDFLPDDDSRDTLTWVLGFLRSFVGLFLSGVEPDQLVELNDEALAGAYEDREFRSFMRAQLALMAAIEAAKQGLDAERCASLIDAAFLAFTEFRSALRERGVWLSPFPNETSDERRASLLRYASRLRETLTDQDWQTLDQARMGDLR